jgi:hypothetical protein
MMHSRSCKARIDFLIELSVISTGVFRSAPTPDHAVVSKPVHEIAHGGGIRQRIRAHGSSHRERAQCCWVTDRWRPLK